MKKTLIILLAMFFMVCATHANTGSVEHANSIISYQMMKADLNRFDPDNWQIQEILSFEIAWHCEQLGSIAKMSPKMCDMVVRNWNTILGDWSR